MLPKAKRLTVPDFKKKGGWKVFSSSHFLLRAAQGPVRSPSRAAAVSSAAVEKKAVGRNRLRRRIYTVLEKHLAKKDGYILAIHARQGAGTLSFAALKEELTVLLNRLP